jgi:hypothetical protein
MPRVMRRALVLPLLVLALAACGGSGTLTKEQYAAKMSHLCLVAADQVRELHMDESAASWKHDGRRRVSIDSHLKSALAALKPPPSIANAVAAYTASSDREFADDKDALALVEGRLHELTTLRALNDQANVDYLGTARPARQIGARGCYIG